jgi:hypothetical protein
VNYLIIGVPGILVAQTPPGNPPERQSSSGVTELGVLRMAGSANGDSSASITAGLRGVTRDPSALPLDAVKLIIRCGDAPFSLNHGARPAHLNDWLNGSAAASNIKESSRLRITTLTKDSVPSKIDSQT